MKFVSNYKFTVSNMNGQKWDKTKKFKIEFNMKFCSYIGPVPINGMQTTLIPPGMQFKMSLEGVAI